MRLKIQKVYKVIFSGNLNSTVEFSNNFQISYAQAGCSWCAIRLILSGSNKTLVLLRKFICCPPNLKKKCVKEFN